VASAVTPRGYNSAAFPVEHLQSIVMIGGTNFEPQFGEMLSQKKHFHSSY
jgi:hypothetical protein